MHVINEASQKSFPKKLSSIKKIILFVLYGLVCLTMLFDVYIITRSVLGYYCSLPPAATQIEQLHCIMVGTVACTTLAQCLSNIAFDNVGITQKNPSWTNVVVSTLGQRCFTDVLPTLCRPFDKYLYYLFNCHISLWKFARYDKRDDFDFPVVHCPYCILCF